MSNESGSGARAVLVTGCSSGIGKATALRLAKTDWVVYATARKTTDLAELAAAGCKTLALDVTKTDARVSKNFVSWRVEGGLLIDGRPVRLQRVHILFGAAEAEAVLSAKEIERRTALVSVCRLRLARVHQRDERFAIGDLGADDREARFLARRRFSQSFL